MSYISEGGLDTLLTPVFVALHIVFVDNCQHLIASSLCAELVAEKKIASEVECFLEEPAEEK